MCGMNPKEIADVFLFENGFLLEKAKTIEVGKHLSHKIEFKDYTIEIKVWYDSEDDMHEIKVCFYNSQTKNQEPAITFRQYANKPLKYTGTSIVRPSATGVIKEVINSALN